LSSFGGKTSKPAIYALDTGELIGEYRGGRSGVEPPEEKLEVDVEVQKPEENKGWISCKCLSNNTVQNLREYKPPPKLKTTKSRPKVYFQQYEGSWFYPIYL